MLSVSAGEYSGQTTRLHPPKLPTSHGSCCSHAARRAVYNNRARLKSTIARQAFKLRAEKVERSFTLILDIGGLRRTWLRGAGNVEKRYLIQVAAHNLGLVIRHRFGAGTPRRRSSGSSVTSARGGVLRSGRSSCRRAQTRGQRPELRRLC